ncbi:hypothetical protein ACFVFQ_31835 [Streptomyces sp. NPDC057743]|uniref:hypothetical protein n=1 Tax=Streptomyces sp. NPDC057743 TaxID=3346236 RepID=UPI0036BD71E3
MDRKTAKRLVQSLSVVLGMINAIVLGSQLAAYHVPLSLLVSCALAWLASTVWFVEALIKAFDTTTYRCPEPDCAFTVRVRHSDAAESRRWQETAAEHPTHLYRA